MAAKYTFRQFQAQYPDDDACLLAILERRYGKADSCPKCGVIGPLTRIQGRRAFACKEGCHTYPCAGTVFEKSPTYLTLWFHAMYLMTATRNGVSAKELQRQLGVTYKCAWRIGHQLRDLMMTRDDMQNPGKLGGHVEIDETYIGGVTKGKGRRYVGNKSVVMGFVERAGDFRGYVVPDAKKASLLPHILKNVEPGAKISTDTLTSYAALTSMGYKHGTVNHFIEQWVKGENHTQSIEGFWSHLKRGIKSTHASVSPQHLHRYVNEFGWRYNNRHDSADMFRRLVARISVPVS